MRITCNQYTRKVWDRPTTIIYPILNIGEGEFVNSLMKWKWGVGRTGCPFKADHPQRNTCVPSFRRGDIPHLAHPEIVKANVKTVRNY